MSCCESQDSVETTACMGAWRGREVVATKGGSESHVCNDKNEVEGKTESDITIFVGSESRLAYQGSYLREIVCYGGSI